MFGSKKPPVKAEAKPVAKKAPVKKPAPKADQPSLADEYPVEFETGRRSRRAAIGKDQAPFADGPELKAWLAGWKLEDGAILG